ncbi:glycosyltransferase family 2 protein [Actinomadura rudentiformis]|uniref:Glycosyltransferase family 2 protein n=1 Tax=Actinomadura rudentiformis TaxID=359158 RepID=A0A6H9YM12_9ACTN|nr:glycosyltransferase family 2 protein [Actinomadura rudentiformis]KAB2342370.1 glycosyltransferase family 2 protein [Actinomadura rudentiformis]
MHTPDSVRATGRGSGDVDAAPRAASLNARSANILSASGQTRRWPTVTAVIPTLNEAANLRWLMPRLTAVDEIVIVDGESTDGTVEYVLSVRPDARIIVEPPTGKGTAMRTGMAAATSEMIIMLDADGSMDPAEFDSFLALLCRGYDFVKGTRYSCGGGSDDLTGLRRLGNSVLTGLANRLYRQNWSDLCYGYVAMRRDAVERLQLESTGFEIETEMCVNAVRAGLRIAEVASHETERRHGESNLNTWRDGWRVLKTMVRLRFQRRLDTRPEHLPLEPLPLHFQTAAFSRTGTE